LRRNFNVLIGGTVASNATYTMAIYAVFHILV
jgi:hypothetical protein